MLKLSSSRGIRIDVPVLSVSWSVDDHSVNIQALKKGLTEHEASDTGGVPRWKSSCPDRLAEATVPIRYVSQWWSPHTTLPSPILLGCFLYKNLRYYVRCFGSACIHDSCVWTVFRDKLWIWLISLERCTMFWNCGIDLVDWGLENILTGKMTPVILATFFCDGIGILFFILALNIPGWVFWILKV